METRKGPLPDTKKFKALMYAVTALAFLVLSYAVLQEYVMPGLGSYVQWRLHYERVISKKGLSLHKGMYWKEKE